MMNRSTILAAAFGSLFASLTLPLLAQEAPLWEHAPETIAPEWGEVFSSLGATRFGPFPAPDDLDGWRQFQDEVNAVREPEAEQLAVAYGVTLRDITIGGVPVLEVTPNEPVREDKIAVYTHGGAYVLNSARAIATSAIIFAAETGLTVMSVDYTLAPHSKWQNTTDEVLAVFAGLAEMGFAGGDIVLYGDSAGGSLAAGSVLKMRDQDMDMPTALILWSPWSDIGEVGDSYATLRDAEPFYTYADVLGPSALAYADAEDHKHPYVSPVYGDYTQGFPPTLIQGGTKELFLSNMVRHYQALDQAGQTVMLDLYEGMPHVFQSVMPNSRESRIALAKSASWVKEHLLQD
ncbi:MAG: alpha/beta hydrolase [Dinoroseobacter sp.]|nr:alpha/beta hydrolase [Dinoroseobacter sp.]